jgi:hypothetical protein
MGINKSRLCNSGRPTTRGSPLTTRVSHCRTLRSLWFMFISQLHSSRVSCPELLWEKWALKPCTNMSTVDKTTTPTCFHDFCDTRAQSHVFTAVAWWRLPTADVPFPPEFPNSHRSQLPASKSNISRLNRSGPLTHWLTNQLLTFPACNISAWAAQKTQFLCCCLRAAA